MKINIGLLYIYLQSFFKTLTDKVFIYQYIQKNHSGMQVNAYIYRYFHVIWVEEETKIHVCNTD